MKKKVFVAILAVFTAAFVCGCNKVNHVADTETEKQELAKVIAEDGTEKVEDTEDANSAVILAESDIENVAEIHYYITEEKVVISEESAVKEIATELAKLRLEKAVPENELLEGGMIVNLIMKNGDVIEFGCGALHIAYGKQYYVDEDMYAFITQYEVNTK